MESYHLKINITFLFVVGGMVIQTDSKIKNTLHLVYSYIIRLHFLIFIVAEYIELMYALKEDFYEVVAILGVAFLYSSSVFKLLSCNTKLVKKLIQQLKDSETEILYYYNNDLKNIYNYHRKWSYLINIGFICTTIITVLPFCISPVLTEMSLEPVYFNETKNNKTVQQRTRSLPLISWFPFDKYAYYYYCYTYDILVLFAGAGLTAACELLFVSLMIYVIGQIKILQYIFKNLNPLARNLSKNAKISYDRAIKYTVKYSIKMHQNVIQ